MSWLFPTLLRPLLRSPRPTKVGSVSDQIRSVKNRPSLIVCTFSSQRHADFGVSSCSLLNHVYVAIVSYFRFFFCPHLLCHFCFAPFAPRDNSFRCQAYTQRPLAFRILQLSDVDLHCTQCVLQFFVCFHQEQINEQPASRLRSVSSSLRRLNDVCAGRVVHWWISATNLQLAALAFEPSNQQRKKRKKIV